MIDRTWIGHRLPPSVLPIERTRVRFFASAIGSDDPVHHDVAAAEAAGYPDLVAPPTFLFAAELESGTLFAFLRQAGVALDRVLHGEQGFTWHRPVCAGEVVTVASEIVDLYARRNGALEFVVTHARAVDEAGGLVAELRSVLIVRH